MTEQNKARMRVGIQGTPPLGTECFGRQNFSGSVVVVIVVHGNRVEYGREVPDKCTPARSNCLLHPCQVGVIATAGRRQLQPPGSVTVKLPELSPLIVQVCSVTLPLTEMAPSAACANGALVALVALVAVPAMTSAAKILDFMMLVDAYVRKVE
ncbi:hypothetical protein [Burkholderia pyrrocinia]|uniref:Uncharacterized protein n=1 Tax=Burkholderia pyrrocinia TaxID=60550 RepID=A0ABZ3BP15_BURPY